MIKKYVKYIVISSLFGVSSLYTIRVRAYDGTNDDYKHNQYIDGNAFGSQYDSYEFDYGLVNFYAQGAANTNIGNYNLSAAQPPKIVDIVRYDHWSSIHRNDPRGWTLEMSKREWATPAVRNSGRIKQEGDYGGGLKESIFAYDRPWYYKTENGGVLFRSSDGIQHTHMRWAVFWYFREKSTPRLGNTYIEFSSNGPKINTYVEDDILWAQPNKTRFISWSLDYYNSIYGQIPQYDGDIKGVKLLIHSKDVNFAKTYDMERGIYDLNTYDGLPQNSAKVSFNSYDPHGVKMGEDMLYHNSMGAIAEFDAEDGRDYKLMSNAYNKWEKGIEQYSEYYNGINYLTNPKTGDGWFDGFRLNSSLSGNVYNYYKVDGTGPVWTGDPIIKNKNEYSSSNNSLSDNVVVDGMNILIKDLHDVRGENSKGVGVDYTTTSDYKTINQYVVIYKSDSNGNSIGQGEKLYCTPGDENSVSDLEFEINFDKSSFKDYFGKLNIQFISSDLLGNVSRSKVIQVEKINPVPEDGDISMVKYDYKESNDTYWVKLGSEFAVFTEGYFKSNYGIYPTSTSLLLLEDNNRSNKFKEHAMEIDSYDYEYKKNNYINDVYIHDVNSYKAMVSDKFKGLIGNNAFRHYDNRLFRNYLQGVHWLKTDKPWNEEEPIDDGRAFRLYLKQNFQYDRYIYDYNTDDYTINYSREEKDSKMWLKVDGTAPTGKVEMNQDLETTDISVSVSNVTDYCTGKKVNGSGVKRIFAKFYPKLYDQYYYEEHDKEYVIQELVYNEQTKTWNTNIDAYSSFGCDDITVQIYGEDNVGNIGLIKEESFPILTLNAKVVPYNDPNCIDEVPIIEEGQYGRLKIKTTGGPTTLIITFDYEIESYVEEGDEPLSTVITIPAERSRYTEYVFKVPLYTPNKKYNINVQAIKKNNYKEADTQFLVSSNVLDGLRTRIR